MPALTRFNIYLRQLLGKEGYVWQEKQAQEQ
jgi:hypothetical protein